MNVLDTYNCDTQTLEDLMHRESVVGDCVDLPDGIYANIEDTLAAVIVNGRFIAELEIYDQRGESRYE